MPVLLDLYRLAYSHLLDLSFFQAVLSEVEQDKLLSMCDRRRREYTVGRWLLRYGLYSTYQRKVSSHLPLPAPVKNTVLAEIWVVDQTSQPPYVPFAEHHQLVFSLSHSGNSVVLLVGAESSGGLVVGVDVERFNPERNIRASSFFCTAEQQRVLDCCDTTTEKVVLFYRLWTQKEAYVKAYKGNVMSDVFKNISFKACSSLTQEVELSAGPVAFSTVCHCLKNVGNPTHYTLSVFSSANAMVNSFEISYFSEGCLLISPLSLRWQPFSVF